MLKNIKYKFKKNFEIFGLVILILFTAIITSYFNYKKNTELQVYESLTDNIYLKKTLKHIIENLEPKYKKVKHKIQAGETFDKILKSYNQDSLKDSLLFAVKSKSKLPELNNIPQYHNIV